MDLALIDSILESVRNCLRVESGFKKETWVIALRKVKEEQKRDTYNQPRIDNSNRRLTLVEDVLCSHR